MFLKLIFCKQLYNSRFGYETVIDIKKKDLRLKYILNFTYKTYITHIKGRGVLLD